MKSHATRVRVRRDYWAPLLGLIAYAVIATALIWLALVLLTSMATYP